MLRKIFVPEKEKGTGGCRKLLSEAIHNVYSSSDIVSVVERRMVRFVVHVSYMGKIKMHKAF
jgi:hypothetical protein